MWSNSHSKQIFFIIFSIFYLLNFSIKCDYKECPIEKPILNTTSGECFIGYCTKAQYSSLECNITNKIIKKQYLNQFLYVTEKSFPIYSSIGTDSEGDIFLETNNGLPYSTKQLFTLESDGREYTDNIKINTINSGNTMFSKSGNGAVVTINGNKCYMKLSSNESLEMYDFDLKKYTFANLKEKLGGYTIKSEKNSLLRTSTENVFIYAYITDDNYLIMQKFKIISNNANNCLQLIKTLKEEVKTISTNIRSCMITVKQYIECIDLDENKVYVIRLYDSNLNFLSKYELERNIAPMERAIYSYHEAVLLKDEISIFVYYSDITENGAKPILVLTKLTVKSNKATLSSINDYLKRDILFNSIDHQFSDTETSLAIFNEYYFGITALSVENGHQNLYVALANIFHNDQTIDTHYFRIPLTDLYDINYKSGLRAFGYKNAYGIQMNYIHNNIPTSGFVVFGYGNSTDPEPVNRLFEKYSSYTINVGDYYQGIDNNLFCYVFVKLVVTEVPNSLYFSSKVGSTTIKKGSSLKLTDVITIKQINGKNPPKGRYVLAFAPYLNEADYEGFTGCAVGADMFGYQIPTNWYPDEYYGRTIKFKFTVGIDCYENCETCTEKGETLDDQKCDECIKRYYFMENTKNCFGETPEGYYFDETSKTYKQCYETCKVCTNEKQGDIENCLVCKDGYLLDNNTNCILDISEPSTEVIDTTFNIVNTISTTNEIINDETDEVKCHPNCLTCKEYSNNDTNMECLTCNNSDGYYLLENKNNCEKVGKPKYNLDRDENILKQCYENCLTCSQKPLFNIRGEIINMNCDTCDESQGFYKVQDTKNCEKNEEIISEVCPENKPILKNGKCVLESCTDEEYENNICVVSNPIIKKQWIDNFPEFNSTNIPFKSTFGQLDNNDILFETNTENPLSERIFYTLDEESRGFYDGEPSKIIKINSDLYSSTGNGALIKLNESTIYLRLSYYESLEIFDFDNEKFSSVRLEDKLGYKIESSINSLLKTDEENTFIYTYITTGNHLINTRFKIISNDAETCMDIIKTVLEDFTTISKNSRRCLITSTQYLECLELDENLNYIIRIYDKDLNFLKQYELDKNKAPLDRAYYSYHEAILLKNETSIFVYFNNIADYNTKPIIVLKKLINKNETLELKDLSEFYDKIKIYENLPYIISDSENSLAKINDNSFALSSLTVYDMSRLLIALFNIYNNDNSIEIKYYDIPLKDLYDINYYNGLQAFGYKNLYGIFLNHKKGEEYKTGFIIFGFGNSTDPEPIKDLFEKNNSYNFNPSEYITLQNNIFCYDLNKIIITNIPDPSTGIILQKNDENKTELKQGDTLSINEEIIITYKGDKSDIPIDDYTIIFTPYLIKTEDNKCAKDVETVGERATIIVDTEEYSTKTLNLRLPIGTCYQNCKTCSSIGKDINDQKCDSCLDNYYFAEGTKNCYDKAPDNYYFDKNGKIYKKCYEKCLSCESRGTSDDDMRCTSCDSDKQLYLYKPEKICMSMPTPGYYIDQKTKLVEKCDISCRTCSSKAIYNEKNQVINCDTCNKDLGFYNYEQTTICINKTKEGEYYDESCKCYKKCYKDCLTCSAGAIDQYHMNCLSCDANKGYEFYPKNSNCLNCKSINKIVNYEQTECIDNVPEGYYENEDDSDSSTLGICHANCIKCSGPPNDQTQNCITCQSGLYLNNGNCVKTYTCPYKFFYQAKIDKSADSKQKVCLEENEECPCALPFFYVSTNECIEVCPLELLLSQACKISNIPHGLSTYINLVILYFKRGLINNISKAFTLSKNFLEIFVQITLEKLLNGKLSLVRRLQNNENVLGDNDNNNYNYQSSNIDFGKCENKIREFYNIPDNIPLNLIKLEIEIKKNDTNANYIQYEIFNPYNRSEKLDLSICQQEKVKIENTIDNSLNVIKLSNLLKSSSKNNKDIIGDLFSENSDFYIDYCTKFTSEDGADVLIQDRYLDYYYQNQLCQSGCTLDAINITSGIVGCSCSLSNGFENSSISNIERIINGENLNENNNNIEIKHEFKSQEYSNTNIKYLKCIKHMFSDEFGKNYILIIFSILLIIHFALANYIFIFKNKIFNDNKKEITNSNQRQNTAESSRVKHVKKKVDKDILSSDIRINPQESSDSKTKLQKKNKEDNEFEGKSSEYNDKNCFPFFIHEFRASMEKREIIISCFFGDIKEKITKVFLLVFSLLNLIIINTFFFSEKNIHKIYLDKNKYNFGYQFKYIISSNIISFILLAVIKKIVNYKTKNRDKNSNKNIKILNKILFFIIIATLLFFWIYVGTITSLFIKAKQHLLINIIICILFDFLLNAVLSIISYIIGIIGIKTENKYLYSYKKKVDDL